MRLLPQTLSRRLLLAFLLPAAVFFGLAGMAGYEVSRALLEDELGVSLSTIAASAAAQISGERLLTVAPGDDVTETRTYRNLYRSLDKLRTSTGMRRIFAVDAAHRVLVDVGGSLPVGAEMPELLRDGKELDQVFSGKTASSQVLFEGNDRLLYKTGYAPVMEGNDVVAAIGVEGSARFFSPLFRLVRAYTVWVVLALLSLTAIALLTARALSRPLSRLVDAALRMGRGDLQTPVPPEPLLDIGILAKELEDMRHALDSRDRQLKMMLAGVAHEVRNPIGGIELFAGLLAEELPPENTESQSHLARIRKELDYLKRMVEDFLTFAREQTIAPQPVDIARLARHAVSLVEADSKQKQIAIELAVPSCVVTADEALVTSALMNLLKNAVQATPEHGRVLCRGEQHPERYTLTILDEGPGVRPELSERIFEPFFTTREKGTGLGLPLAKKLMRAHGGDLRLDAHAAKGARFSLWLPLGPAPSSNVQ